MFLDDQSEADLAHQKEQFILIAMESERKELDSDSLGFTEVLPDIKKIREEQKRHFKEIEKDFELQTDKIKIISDV